MRLLLICLLFHTSNTILLETFRSSYMYKNCIHAHVSEPNTTSSLSIVELASSTLAIYCTYAALNLSEIIWSKTWTFVHRHAPWTRFNLSFRSYCEAQQGTILVIVVITEWWSCTEAISIIFSDFIIHYK